jgi:hypothetical protein
MSQETSCQWRVQLDPSKEYSMTQRWYKKSDDVELDDSDQYEDIKEDNETLE